MKKSVLAFLSLIIMFVCFDEVRACICRKDPEDEDTPQELKAVVLKEVDKSAAVFSGEILEISKKGIIRVKVNKIWKGDLAKEITLSYWYYVIENGQKGIDGCWYQDFEVGKSFLIYADSFENVLQVYGCSRTQPLNKAERDIVVLDTLKQSTERQPVPGRESFGYLWRKLLTIDPGRESQSFHLRGLSEFYG